MQPDIEGLHHVTALASNARVNNAFFTGLLGLRRVKTTVNFDAPDVYHLYYGDRVGTPGSVVTYFPFERAQRGRSGPGAVAETAFVAPRGSLDAWHDRIASSGLAVVDSERPLGDRGLRFEGPDGERLVLVEDDVAGALGPHALQVWSTGDVGPELAIRGFHSVSLSLRDIGPERELLAEMGYETVAHEGATTRMRVRRGGRGAALIDLSADPNAPAAIQGAGSIHHIAFAVADAAAQVRVRELIAGLGFQVTPQIDRDYFRAVYFRTPGGILFEVATNLPGFLRDEPVETLGQYLKLPTQHQHLRPSLEQTLPPLE